MDAVIQSVAIRARAGGRLIFIGPIDGRHIALSADRFRILNEATDEQLKSVQPRLNSAASRWEDLTVRGAIARRFQLSLRGAAQFIRINGIAPRKHAKVIVC